MSGLVPNWHIRLVVVPNSLPCFTNWTFKTQNTKIHPPKSWEYVRGSNIPYGHNIIRYACHYYSGVHVPNWSKSSPTLIKIWVKTEFLSFSGLPWCEKGFRFEYSNVGTLFQIPNDHHQFPPSSVCLLLGCASPPAPPCVCVHACVCVCVS